MTSSSTTQPKPVVLLAFANEQEGTALPPRPARGGPAASVERSRRRRTGACASWKSAPTSRSTRSSRSSAGTAAGSRSSTTPATPAPDRLLLESARGRGARPTPRGWRGSSAGKGACNWSSSTAARPAPGRRPVGGGASTPWSPPRGRSTTTWPASSPSPSTPQLAAGRTFRDAFERGRGLKAAHGTSLARPASGDPRPNSPPADIADDRGFPWDSCPPGAEQAERREPGRPRRRPLFGLPGLPPGTRLPPTPYPPPAAVHAQRGRGLLRPRPGDPRAVRPRHLARVAAGDPLLRGRRAWASRRSWTPACAPAGDGARVIYLRRDADSACWRRFARPAAPRDGRPGPRPAAAWRPSEATPARPLVVILDQAEEAFTRPASPAASTRPRAGRSPRGCAGGGRAGALPRPARAPRGRLILSFRKEWLQEFERPYDDASSATRRMLLGPLDRAGSSRRSRARPATPSCGGTTG